MVAQRIQRVSSSSRKALTSDSAPHAAVQEARTLRSHSPDATAEASLGEQRARPTLSVVIPTRHEAASIEPFLDRVLGTLQGIPTEMIVVDDSDHDHTEDLY
jgi:cellulose synthase/poly-beta-1,6-N-acetylglucosamine synthase-like glycosyltransferase